jgi:hypothetical protein
MARTLPVRVFYGCIKTILHSDDQNKSAHLLHELIISYTTPRATARAQSHSFFSVIALQTRKKQLVPCFEVFMKIQSKSTFNALIVCLIWCLQ